MALSEARQAWLIEADDIPQAGGLGTFALLNKGLQTAMRPKSPSLMSLWMLALA